MTTILIFIAGISLGYYFRGRIQKQGFVKKRNDGELDEMRKESKEALSERTEKRKNKILELMGNEAVHQKELNTCDLVDRTPGITSAEVEKLLDVSGATVRKYLNELEIENKIKQVGKSGQNVYYIKI